MNIKVSDHTLGECSVNTYKEITKEEEYLIKSLCVLQLMCMNRDEDLEKFKNILKIMKDATQKIEEVFREKELIKFDATNQFR